MKIAVVFWLVLAFWGLPGGTLHAGQKKPPAVTVRFYAEGTQADGDKFIVPVMLPNPKRQAFLQKIPVVAERELSSFYPFPTQDGTFGAYFKFDPHGRNLIETYTTSRMHSLIVAMVNGRVVTALVIDRPIKDGILTIPFGLTLEEVNQLRAEYPLMGQGSGKKKKGLF